MKRSDSYIRVSVRVSGRVQGVGFRYWMLKHAQRLCILGHVSNCTDGSVSAVFCGNIGAVEEIIRLCCDGPPSSRVDNLSILSREPIFCCPEEFRILR